MRIATQDATAKNGGQARLIRARRERQGPDPEKVTRIGDLVMRLSRYYLEAGNHTISKKPPPVCSTPSTTAITRNSYLNS